MNKKVVASIEIGLSSVKLLVSEVVENKQHVLASERIYIKNINKYMKYNPSKLATKINELIARINYQLKYIIKKYIVIIPHHDILIKKVHSEIENYNPNYKITKKLQILLAKEFKHQIPSTHTIIHYVPWKYWIDNKPIERLPINMYGRHIGLEAITYSVDYDYFAFIENFISFLNIEVIGFFPKGVGLPLEILDTFNKYDLIIDIGDGYTNLNVYVKGFLIKNEIADIGILNVINKLMNEYDLGFGESIKIIDAYGKFSFVEEEQNVTIKSFVSEGSFNKHSFKKLTFNVLNSYLIEEGKAIIQVIRQFLRDNEVLFPNSINFVGRFNDLDDFDVFINDALKQASTKINVYKSTIPGAKASEFISLLGTNKLAWLYEAENIHFNESEKTTNEIIPKTIITDNNKKKSLLFKKLFNR